MNYIKSKNFDDKDVILWVLVSKRRGKLKIERVLIVANIDNFFLIVKKSIKNNTDGLLNLH